jgi:peptidoglycan-associated lipoprotein
MKKLLFTLAALIVLAGCPGTKKTDVGTTETVNNPPEIVTETTGGGQVEKIDVSPMNFSKQGSDSGTIEGLSTIYFDFDSAALNAAEQKKLEGNADWLKANGTASMMIEGHCDQKGSAEYNMSLGERRANSIQSMLVTMGIAKSRLSVVSFGKEKMLNSGDTEEEMGLNRRSNFVPQIKK